MGNGEGLGVSLRWEEKRPKLQKKMTKGIQEKMQPVLAQLAIKYRKESVTEVKSPYTSSKILQFLSFQMDHKRA